MTPPPNTPHPLTGSCLCRAVRYRIDAVIDHAEHCHCSRCRKAHGAAFSTNAVVPAQALTVEGAEHLSAYRASTTRERLFCARCGSPLFIRRLNAPDRMVVTLGTLDDDPGVRPDRHVFVGSKAPWHDLDARLPAHAIYPGFEPEPQADRDD